MNPGARLGAVASIVLAASVVHAQPEQEPSHGEPTEAPAPPEEEEDAGEQDETAEEDTADATEPVGDPRADAERRREAAQVARETARPREPLVDVELPSPPKWERLLEVGASFAFVLRPFAGDSEIGYNPGPGFGVHLQWPIVEWLRLHPYFMHVFHSLDIPLGALSSGTPLSISPDATISDESVATFVLGVKLAPTLQLTDRWRGWVTAGVGWGRFEFPAMTVTDTDGRSFEIRDRAATMVEFPLGVGMAFDVIERWMSIHYEFTAAPITGQSGDAYEIFQTVDADGQIRDVGAFGAIDVSFVQTLGVSIIL